MAKRQSKSLLALLLAAAVIGALLLWRPTAQTPRIEQMAIPSPSPSLAQTAEASDGKISLELTRKQGIETTIWSLTASQAGTGVNKRIWSAVLPSDTNVSVPFNAVSPDNKYLFLKQAGPDKTRYLALTTSGAPISQDFETIEFGELFESKYPEYKITAVTGWGGLNLIVLNTDKASGGTGPSFWFEIPSQAFIRLSNRFN